MTRCCAPVTDPQAVPRRASASSSSRCQRQAHLLVAGKGFCFQHDRIWRTHYAIVERIRSFPDKVI